MDPNSESERIPATKEAANASQPENVPYEAADNQIPASDINHSEGSVQRVKYSELQDESTHTPLGNIDYIKDVNLEASVELGDAQLSVEKILQLSVGSVVELMQTVGDPVRLLINHNTYALGEVVVIGDKFGIRITKLVRTA
jgi:flagellar motor switch protein FliN